MDVHVALGMKLCNSPVNHVEKVVSLVGFRCDFSVCTCGCCTRFVCVVTEDVGTLEVCGLDFPDGADNLASRFTLAGSFPTIKDVCLGNFLVLVLGHEYIFDNILNGLDAYRLLVSRCVKPVTYLVSKSVKFLLADLHFLVQEGTRNRVGNFS